MKPGYFLSKKKNPAPMASYSGISWLRVQIDLPQPGCLLSPSNTENIVLTWCQLCRHCWHSRLLLWQLLVPPMPTKLASSRLSFFSVASEVVFIIPAVPPMATKASKRGFQRKPCSMGSKIYCKQSQTVPLMAKSTATTVGIQRILLGLIRNIL